MLVRFLLRSILADDMAAARQRDGDQAAVARERAQHVPRHVAPREQGPARAEALLEPGADLSV